MATESAHTPVPVVSCDSHTGPLVEEQLRPYCPKQHLERFNEFLAAHRRTLAAAAPGEIVPEYPEMEVAGHHDRVARLLVTAGRRQRNLSLTSGR